MKIASLISRYLLGFIFLVFGLNGFFNFIPMPPPKGLAAQYMGAIFASHFFIVVYLFQIVPGILLLVNRYVPLALAMLAPIVVNIVCFHALMAPAGLPIAIVVSLLWLVAFTRVRSVFADMLQQRVPEQTSADPVYSSARQTT
jgi:putative oxidoreductase